LINQILHSKTFHEFFSQIRKIKISEQIFTSNLNGTARSFATKQLSENENQILLIFSDKTELYETNVELEILELKTKKIVFDDFSTESIQEKLTEITNSSKFVILSTKELFEIKLPSKQEVNEYTLKIEAGTELDYDNFIEYLNLYNYQRENFTEVIGTFSVRGSIIDFWSFSEKNPGRIEFNGDLVESIRYFDAESQRSLGTIKQITLAPNVAETTKKPQVSIFEYLNLPLIITSENIFDLSESENQSNLNHDLIIDEDLKEDLFGENTSIEKVEIQNNELHQIEDFFAFKSKWLIEKGILAKENVVKLKIRQTPVFNSNYKMISQFLIDQTREKFKILITSENELQRKRLEDLFSELDPQIKREIDNGIIKIIVLPIKNGFILEQDNLILLSDYKIFGKPYRTKITQKQKPKKSQTKDFSSLKRGDFVVHETFGIGEYQGLEKIKIGNVEQESLKILYSDGDSVYVNLNYLGLVKKFSSKDGIRPTLNKLGSGTWQKTKAKVKKQIKDAARDLIKLYAKRKSSVGFQFEPDSVWQTELEASFFYEDTPDQTKVTEEIKKDMESDSPMDRLVCGDVGFGKTEIAIRSAFKATNSGKQVAILVPTTILAEQHYNTFRDRLLSFPVRVETLSRFVSKKNQTQIIEDLEKGKVDIVVGTHRLLSKDVIFKDLGLLIIDEEHRFGVMAKEKIRQIKENVDTLTLTATPIPRTLNLSLLGARDLSIIGTPPPNRQPIYTIVDVFDISKVRQWILKEKNRGGQIFFVHDRVQTISKIATYLKKHIPEITFGIAHGQMNPNDLEKVLFDFTKKEFDMLIATKIIESGIDIPNANTIIINRADRFGLAELHQLRGRVGRADKQAHAFLLVPSLKTITKTAVKRLEAIEEFTEIGSGFNLSMRDLEIRGAGNLLGTEQSGAIDTVGFDLYLKLLDEAIVELKNEEFSATFNDLPKHFERTDTTIDSFFEIGIPNYYMETQTDRLAFYTSLFSMVKEEEVEEIKEELTDRFGKIPEQTELLIKTAILKFHASFVNFERIVISMQKVSIILPDGKNKIFYEEKFNPMVNFLLHKFGNKFQLIHKKENVKIELPTEGRSPEKILEMLINIAKGLK